MGNATGLGHFFVRIKALYIPVIFQLIKIHVCHSKLFTLIYIRSSLHHMKTGCKHLCRNFTVFSAVIPVAGNAAWLIVVGQIQAVPCFVRKSRLPLGQCCLPFRKRHFVRIPFSITVVCILSCAGMFKLEYHIELASVCIRILLCFL